MQDDSEQLGPLVMTMQIIAGALVMGVVSFAVVAALIGGFEPAPPLPILSYMGAAFGLISVGISTMMAGVMEQQARRTLPPDDTTKLLQFFQTKMIIRFAILEGAAFFNLVALIIEKQWWSLLIAAVLVSIMAMNFPTRTRVEHWLEIRRMEA